MIKIKLKQVMQMMTHICEGITTKVAIMKMRRQKMVVTCTANHVCAQKYLTWPTVTFKK